MFSEYVQDSGHYLLMMFDHVGIYQDVVHVDHHIALIDEVLKDVVHHHLEGGWTIGETEEHNGRLKEALIHSKGGFPFIALFDSHIVIFPMYIQLHEIPGLQVRNSIDNIWYEGEWVGVLHCHHIEFSVILDKL